jgi:hypothetical protein
MTTQASCNSRNKKRTAKGEKHPSAEALEYRCEIFVFVLMINQSSLQPNRYATISDSPLTPTTNPLQIICRNPKKEACRGE